MPSASAFSEQDFLTLEQLLDQDAPTRHQTLEAITPESRRAMFRRMLELDADQDTAIDGSASDAFPELLRPDGLIHAGLDLVREVGRGGMGVVYEAIDTASGRAVAVKVLSVPLALSPDAEVRFQREADSLRRLDHPNIVAVQRTGSIEGLPYIVFDLVDGQTLQDRLADVAGSGGVGEAWWWRAAEWIRVLAGALEHAHQRQVVHRDVKPANILLGEGDVPRLTDFGIARVIDATTITQGGEAPGSPAYMSPEQLGVIDAEAGPQSDVYGLGLVLFECLTLTRARSASSKAEVARDCLHRPASDPRRINPLIPRSLAAVAVQALATDPKDRYPTAGAMAQALDLAARGLLRPSRHPWRTLRRAIGRRRTLVAVAVTLLVCATVATAMLVPRAASGTIAISAPPTARLFLREIDPATHLPGPARPIGTTRTLHLRPGTYRVELVTPTGLREYTREVGDRQRTSVTVRPDAGLPARQTDMVFVPGGIATVGHATPPAPELGVRAAVVAPFWIDRCEVSNAEYRAFVLATGRASPPIWPTPYPESWDNLPVTGVSVEDARAYAEWVGKRLPTDVEWEVAAAGPNAIPFPWTGPTWGGPEIVIDLAEESRAWSGDPSDPAVRQAFVDHVREVTNAGPDVSPSGIENAWGNVAEWTESTVTLRAEGVPVSCHIAKGRSWADRNPHIAFLQSINLAPIGTVSPGIGFRCVVSAPDGSGFTPQN